MKGVGIGAGYFSRFQYEAWTRIPEVEIGAICDLVEEKARAMMTQFGIPRYYSDWREMIRRESPDFVDIITPPDTHEDICAYTASRGVHIICQKPLAPSFEGGCRIVEAAQASGVRFMVHENWRWQPWYRKIREIQQSGTIGEFTHLVGDLGAAQNGDTGPRRTGGHQSQISAPAPSGVRRQPRHEPDHAFGGGVCPMGAAECIIDIDVAERGEESANARTKPIPFSDSRRTAQAKTSRR